MTGTGVESTMRNTPSPNGGNGQRNGKGQFVKGHPGGPGNPQGRYVAAWRAALFDAVSPDDIRAVVGVLVDRAKAGEPWAVRELLDRALGKVQPAPDDRDAESNRVVTVVVPNELDFGRRD